MIKNIFDKKNKNIEESNETEAHYYEKSTVMSDFGLKLKKIRSNHIIKIVFAIIGLFFLLLSLARIPYVGVFFDSVIFSFIFGYAKYLLYIYFIALLVQIIINRKIKILFSKRFFLSIFLSALFLSILFSGIELLNLLANNKGTKNLINNYIQYWNDYIFNFNGTFVFGKNGFLDGGIIGTLVAATSGFFLIIFAIIAIISIYLLLFKSWRNVFMQKTKNIKDKIDRKKKKESLIVIDGNEYVQEQLSFISGNKNEKTKKIELLGSANDINYLESLLSSKKSEKNFNKLDMSSLNFDINLIKEKITLFFRQNDIFFTNSNIKNKESYIEFSFETNKPNCVKIKSLINEFKDNFKKDDVMIYINDDQIVIRFSTIKTKLGNYCLKLLRTKIENPLNYTFVLNNNYQPIVLDLVKNNLIMINSTNDKNVYNLLTNIVSSISWNYNKNNVQIFYLSNSNIFLPILNSPNVANIKISGANNVLNFLLKLESYCNDLLLKFKEKKCSDVYKLNNISSKIKPNRVIIINEINHLIQLSPDIVSTIKRINEVSKQCGVSFILADNSSNFESFSEIKSNIYCLFKTSSEVSNKVIRNSVASKINEYNDAVLYNNKTENYIYTTTYNYNDSEINEILHILSGTYKEFYI